MLKLKLCDTRHGIFEDLAAQAAASTKEHMDLDYILVG